MESEITLPESHHAPMPEMKPFIMEVTIDAPQDAVWRAVSDPAEIRRWFGWDYPGLEEEIRMIFVDDTTKLPPQRLEFPGMGALDIVPDGSRSVVRLVWAGGLADAKWDDLYDGMEEGWRTFFHQLKYYLERRAGQDRRTLYLTGLAPAPKVVDALDALAPGDRWQESRHQRAVAPFAERVDLVSVLSPQPLESHEPAKVAVTVTTYGLDDAAFADVQREWTERWSSLVPEGKVTA
jgi:hypothetical protein